MNSGFHRAVDALSKCSAMITEEGKRLGQRWDRISSSELDRYLIQDLEHPAYNAQSVLIRSFIIDRLFPTEATSIIEAELYYSACASFALAENRAGRFALLYNAIKYSAPGYDLLPFLQSDARDRFGKDFDVSQLLDDLAICLSVGFDHFRSPFEMTWKSFLSGREFQRCQMIEFGCGSGNDYRMWAASGLSSLLNYTGIDVSSANITNARNRFPEEKFIVGDVCSIQADDQSYDVAVAFDVYEHLSPRALKLALQESLRVTRDECWMSFFNVDSRPDHFVRELEDYHWNLLSIELLAEEVSASGFDVDIYNVPNILESRFDGYRHYNREAHIIVARRWNREG